MSTSHEPPDLEVIELDPTVQMDLDGPTAPHRGGGVALVEGTLASLVGETHDLRRSRLASAAIFIAVVFAVVCLWYFFQRTNDHFWLTEISLGLRAAIAAGVAALLLSRSSLSRTQVKTAEYVLFGSLMLLMAYSQYVVNLDLFRDGQMSQAVALVKNGIFGTVILMIIYGLLIPNDAATTAKVVLTMALIQVIAMVLVMEHPEVSSMVEQFRTTDHTGSNFLILMIGASLAIYGSYILNGLRTELHEARKFGQYRLVRSLGAGGMGEVYLAEHALLKRPCALKLIRPDAGAEPVALARFEREVQSSARLAHHNTIEIYDYGHTEDGTFYYVMEYLKGLSLGDLVKQAGPLPAGRVIYIFRQICAGLAEAHGLGLIHRDLKPANVFVAVLGGEFDVAKVLDFGLVKVTKEPEATTLTAEMTVSGTPHYMAPEQAAASRDLDARADVYALGAMLYYALTGRPPFNGDNAIAVMMAHARDPVARPSEVQPGIPGDLEEVVLRALAKNPADRFSSVRELSDALAACAAASEWGPRQAEEWWAATGAIETATSA